MSKTEQSRKGKGFHETIKWILICHSAADRRPETGIYNKSLSRGNTPMGSLVFGSLQGGRTDIDRAGSSK